MNAKKSCSLVLILTALSAAGMRATSAQNALINVTGSLVNPTCTATGTYQEDFGEVYIDKISSSTLSTRLINVKLTNCSNTTATAKVTFSGTVDDSPYFFKNQGTAIGVNIRAYKDNAPRGEILSNGAQWTKNVNATSHSVTFPTVFTLERKYVASIKNYEAITSGTVLAIISVSFSYS